MSNILDSPSGLHNYKQANGIYKVSANSVAAYKLERKLFRILNAEIRPTNALKVAKASGFSVIEIEDLIEGKAYDLGETQLFEAIEAYETGGIAACLKSIHEANTEELEIEGGGEDEW